MSSSLFHFLCRFLLPFSLHFLCLPSVPPFARCCCLSLMASSATVPHVAREVHCCLLAGEQREITMCWWCQPQLHTDAAGAFIKDGMTHLLSPCQYYTLPSFLPSHKERGAAVSKGVRSCHFSNANREPRNTSLPLFDVNNINTHRHTFAQTNTQPCFPVPPPHIQVVSFSLYSYVSFLSPLVICYRSYQALPA